MTSSLDIYDEKEFEMRSDNIGIHDLEVWNIANAHFIAIQKKLIGPGAKLLVGPRGTGKTHQMRIVYKECISTLSTKPVSIFTSFGKYYYLEPYLAKAPNAIQIFHTWVLCKILEGCYRYIHDLKLEVNNFIELQDDVLAEENIAEFISKAERMIPAELINDPLIAVISITKVVNTIENITARLGKHRAILLLDDAAITFTPDYLIEFFDIFRSLKTRIISPKASVYPGTTQYGPRFHVGHDAEMINCWLSVIDSRYIEFMDSFIEKRFKPYTAEMPQEILDIFKYGSFGIPRAFISLLGNYRNLEETNQQARFNRTISEQTKYIKSEYGSIEFKMPQYKGVIEAGMYFFERVVEALKDDNKELTETKNIFIGIEENSIREFKLSERMIRFLIEAGLLYEESTVKHGSTLNEVREYRRYIPHMLFLIENRTFSKSRGFNASEVLSIIKSKDKKHPLRRNIGTILDQTNKNKLKLDLPPCQNCKTPRLSEEQRFCHICGSPLIKQSAFENCMQISIDQLPVPEWQKAKIKSELSINTIGQLLALHDPSTELRKIRNIGVKRSEKIYQKTLDLVEEFLT